MATANVMSTTSDFPAQDRLRFHLAWLVSAGLLVAVGEMVFRSDDPLGSISVLTSGNPTLMMIKVVALTAVAAAMATAIAGRVYPDIGAFALGIGLTLVSLRGDNMTSMLMERGGSRWFCVWLVVDGLFWFLAMLVAMVVSAVVVRWLASGRSDSAGVNPCRAGVGGARVLMAAPLIPGIGGMLFRRFGADERREWRQGLKHLATATVLGLVLIGVVCSGTGERAISHGQAVFAVAVAFYVGVGRAEVFFPTASTWWSCLSVPVVCLVAYTIAMCVSFPSILVDGLVSFPSSNYLRILPLTYISAGTSAALLARWRAIHLTVARGGH